MSMLAFDPDRLEALRRRMVMAAAELRSIRSDEPSAHAALHAVTVAAEELEEVWLPFVQRLASNDALLPRDRGTLGRLDNSLAWVMTKGYGWTAGSDPLAAGPMDAATARALGVRISALDPVALSHDGAAMTDVASALDAIAGDRHLADDLLRNWTSLAHFADVLGDVRSRALAHDPYVDTDLSAIDALLARLADVLRASSVDPLPLLDHVSPYTAASMIAALDLDDDQLARATDRIAQRVAHGDDALLDQHDGPRAIDLLLPLLVARPRAAAALVGSGTDHVDELLAAATDRAAVYRMVLAATDPAVMSVADAGRIVPALVTEFVGGRGLVTDPGFIGDLVVPWSAQFAAGNHDWEMSEDDRHDLLVAAMHDAAALARFVERADEVLAAATEHFRTAAYDTKVELTAYVGMMGEIVMNGTLVESSHRRRGWNLFTGAGSIGASLATGVAIGLLATGAVMYLQWKTAPNPHRAEHAAIWRQDVTLTMMAAAQVHALDRQLRAEGLIPASVPAPPQADPNRVGGMPSMGFIEAMGPWIRQLPGGEDGQISLRMQQAMFMYVNPADSEIRGMEYVRGR